MIKYFSVLCLCFCAVVSQAQQLATADFKTVSADLVITENSTISGMMSVTFRALEAVDSVYLDAVKMEFKDLNVSRVDEEKFEETRFKNDDERLIIYNQFQANTDYKLEFWYSGTPKKAMYFIDDQIWTQGQGQYTSNWLPSIDDVNDKIIFDITLTYRYGYVVLANGKLINKEPVSATETKWQYDMTSPMSSYLVAFAIGKYHKKREASTSGVPLEFYYYPQDSLKFEPTFRYSRQMFDFLEQEIGIAYPWQIYRQVPVKDFLYSGMENTSLTIFSDALVVDNIGFNDQNYINVNAHELAHQWFGNLVTASSSSHHWLQEGFATYYALLAEREVFGEDYYYWQLYDYAQQLLSQESNQKSTSLLDPKSSSLTFYQKGSWALHSLRELVGTDAFRSATKNYLEKHEYGNVETSDFINEAELTSGQDLSEFVSVWIEGKALPEDAMVKSLKKSGFITEYLEVSCEKFPSKCHDYLVSDISDKAKIKILLEEGYVIKLEDFNNTLEVRRAIAQILTTIPQEMKLAYESLLKDKSYVTIETALYNLWVNFPQDRSKYLQQTSKIYGSSDYNVRLLWLALHLNTFEYQADRKEEVFEELRSYTEPVYSFDLRMNAFKYLKLLNQFDEISISNLIATTKHHNWRFRQFSNRLLMDLEGMANYKDLISKLKNAVE